MSLPVPASVTGESAPAVGGTDAADTASSHFPSSMLPGNPDCPDCKEAWQRSQTRYQEKMAAIRETERLQNYNEELEFQYKNVKLMSDRQRHQFSVELLGKDEQLKQIVEQRHTEYEQSFIDLRAALEKESQDAIQEKQQSIERHQNTIRGLIQEKEKLKDDVQHHRSRFNEEKERRVFLELSMADVRKKVDDAAILEIETSKLKTELEATRVDNAKLTQNNEKKDLEIAWLKAEIQKREDQHKMAMDTRNAYFMSQMSELHQTTPTPTNQQTASQRTPKTASVSHHGADLNISPSSSTPPASALHTKKPPNHNNNARTPRRGRSQPHTTDLTPEIIRERQPLPTPPAPTSSFVRQLFQTGGVNTPSKQSGVSLSAATSSSNSAQMPPPSSTVTPQTVMMGLDALQQKQFKEWVRKQVLEAANSRQNSGRPIDQDLELFHSNAGVRGYAMHKAVNHMIKSQGPQLRKKWQDELMNLLSTKVKQTPKESSSSLQQSGSQLEVSDSMGLSSQPNLENCGPQDATSAVVQNEERSASQVSTQAPNVPSNAFSAMQEPGPMHQLQTNPETTMQAPFPHNSIMQFDPQMVFPNMGSNLSAEITNPFQQQSSQITQSEQFSRQGREQIGNQFTDFGNMDMRAFFPNNGSMLQGSVGGPFLNNSGGGQGQVNIEEASKGTFMSRIRNAILNTGNTNDNNNDGLRSLYPPPPESPNAQFQDNSFIDVHNSCFGQPILSSLPQGTHQAHTNISVAPVLSPTERPSSSPAFPSPMRFPPTQIPPRAAKSSASAIAARNSEQPKDIPDGGYRGTACLECHSQWWNTWCDENPQSCYNCQKKGKQCRRPRCDNFDNGCADPNCKWAHSSDGFSDTYPKPKNGMKRKTKKGDDHEEPPRKKQAGFMYQE